MTVYTPLYDLVICIMHYVILSWFFRAFFEPRKATWLSTALLIFGVASILAVVNQLHDLIFNLVVSFLLAILLNFALFHGTKSQRLLLSGLAIGIGVCIENAMVAAVSVMLGEKIEVITSNSEVQFAYALICQIIFFFIISFVIGFFRKKKYTGKSEGISGLLLLPVSSMIAGIVMLYLDQWVPPGHAEIYFAVSISCLILLVSNLIVFRVYDKSLDKYILEAKNLMLERSHIAQLDYFKSLEKLMEKMRVERHDFRSHLIVIDKMIELDGSEVTNYIKKLIDSQGAVDDSSLVDVRNPVVNAILMVAKDTCRHEGIKIDIALDYDDLSFIDPIDSVALFANALDNAVEACRKISHSSESRFIQINISRINGFIVIMIDNTCDEKTRVSASGLVSSKNNPERHGYGFSSMENAAKKYSGSITYSYNGDDHLFSLMIRLESGEYM